MCQSLCAAAAMLALLQTCPIERFWTVSYDQISCQGMSQDNIATTRRMPAHRALHRCIGVGGEDDGQMSSSDIRKRRAHALGTPMTQPIWVHRSYWHQWHWYLGLDDTTAATVLLAQGAAPDMRRRDLISVRSRPVGLARKLEASGSCTVCQPLARPCRSCAA